MQIGVRLVTSTPIYAMAFQPGTAMLSKILRIPKGSIIQTVAKSHYSAGVMEVQWQMRRYVVLISDLDEQCAACPTLRLLAKSRGDAISPESGGNPARRCHVEYMYLLSWA